MTATDAPAPAGLGGAREPARVAVVVPTIRQDCAERWLAEWRGDLAGARVIIVEDNPEPTFDLPGADHYAWDSIDADLGGDAWIIPRRTSACRSYGFLKALEAGADIIWTTDDDCYPEPARRGRYLEEIRARFAVPVAVDGAGWWNTIAGTGLRPRGYPYGIRDQARPVLVHHGLWSNVPDLDGITQLAHPGFRLPSAHGVDVVPERALFPFCIMNVAFKAEAAPLLYMLLMGQDQQGKHWGFDRFDDIWAGLFVKRVADRLGYAVTSGAPSVHHSRASDPHRNVELEAAGMRAHEEFWPYIRDVKLASGTIAGCYLELAAAVGAYQPHEPYWGLLSSAMTAWARLSEKARGAALR